MPAKKFSLTAQILSAMGLGIVIGLIINSFPSGGFLEEYIVKGLFDAVGKVFVRALNMLVVPIVFVSLVCGVCSLKDIRKLGRVGGKTLLFYLATTAIAISMALLVANIVDPGVGFDLASGATFEGRDAPSLKDVFVNIVSANPLKSMVEGKMLQIILFAVLFGLAAVQAGNRGKRVHEFLEDVNEVLMKFIMILMKLAPYGVFCLICGVFATQGFGAFGPLLKYFFLVIVVLLIHAGVTYPVILKVFTGLSPLKFFKNMKDPIAFAFSTASSNATIPVTLETVEHKMGADNSVASFTVPLGATINMDGTAIMQGCATVFIAQAYNIDISFNGYLMVILTATLASIGTAGVPGVGLIMLSMVLRQVGLPVEGIGLILGVDRLLDMCRTAVNICGDATVTCIVAKGEGALSEKVFNS